MRIFRATRGFGAALMEQPPPGPIDPSRIFVCSRCHVALEIGQAAPVKWFKGDRTSLPGTCQRCLDARKREPAQKKRRQAIAALLDAAAAPVVVPLGPRAAVDLLGALSGGSYRPSDAVIKAVQEMIDVMAAEPEVFLADKLHDPMLGNYITTHPRLPHIKGRPGVHLPYLRTVSRTAPSAVIIDTNAQKIVARVFYPDRDRVPVLAEQWRVLQVYSPANLKKNLRPVQRGEKHDDLGKMYGYGFRVPQGGMLRATEDVSYYSMAPGADAEWVSDVEDLLGSPTPPQCASVPPRSTWRISCARCGSACRALVAQR